MVINPCFNDLTQEEFDAGHKRGKEVFQIIDRMIGKLSNSLKNSYHGFKDCRYGETLGFSGGVPPQSVMDLGQFALIYKREMIKVS